MHLPESDGGATNPTRTAILLIHSGAPISEFLSKTLEINFALSEIVLPTRFDESEIINGESELRRLRDNGYEVFLFGIHDGALIALRLAQLYGDEIAGLILHSFEWNGPRKFLKRVQSELYLIDQPLMMINSADFSDEISTPTIREVTMLNDEIESAVAEQVHGFMNEVRSGNWRTDERDLIDAEFDSIVAGLNLDQSAPTNYLDSLDRKIDEDGFQQPNPDLVRTSDPIKRNALIAMVVGPIYALLVTIIGFNPFGIEPWPGVLMAVGGVATFLYRWQGPHHDDDGAIL